MKGLTGKEPLTEQSWSREPRKLDQKASVSRIRG